MPASCYQAPFYKNWIYEVLGRMCHLLQDMSVPAHAHVNSHVGKNGMYSDYYENNAKYFHQWTADELFSQNKVLIDPYQQSWGHPLAYLMYFLNQVTDHYASGIDYGDYSYDSSCPDLNTYIHQGDLPGSPSQINWTNCSSMHDVLQPLAIRATAGLLYWFAQEAGLLPRPLTSVTIFGDFFLFLGSTGYWYASPSNGMPPLNYNWQIMYLGDFSSAATSKSKLYTNTDKIEQGGIIINAPPSNSWITVGANSPTYSRVNNGSDPRDFKLRCIVTDASNTTKTSNEFYVDILSEYPPQQSVVQNNSDVEKAALMKESIFEPKPTEYSISNYPNPFNPTTTIKYQLPEAGLVTIKVYDILGKEVVELINEQKEAGYYEVNFSAKGGSASGGGASNLPSGIYIYTIRAGKYVESKKMILMK
ncbi:MAG: T9SS type A sorting domain-containing protein [Bacteroidota bacterium]